MSKPRPPHIQAKPAARPNPATTAAVLAFEMRAPEVIGGAATAPQWVQVFPLGEIAAVDGRSWRLSDPSAVVDRVKARLADRPILVDYDHRSHFEPYSGGDQLAAGWVSGVEVREGGIWVSVDWTPAAATSIAAREYRYVSPEFTTDTEGEILALDAVALVNRPALRMAALASAQTNPGEPDMKKIALALGLAEDADEAAILAAIETKATELASAKKPPAPDSYVPRADYDTALASAETARSELAALKKAARDAEVETVIASAVAAGKIAPASKAHYVALAATDEGLKQVKALCATLPKVVADPGVDPGSAAQGSALTDVERHTAAALGVSEADFIKARGTAA